MRCPNEKRLDDKSQVPQRLVQRMRPEPVSERVPVFGRGLGEERQRVKVRLVELDYPGDGQVTDRALGQSHHLTCCLKGPGEGYKLERSTYELARAVGPGVGR